MTSLIRPYRGDDDPAVEALVAEAWPSDRTLRDVSSIHGEDLDGPDRWRRTLVFVQHDALEGVGTLLATARHPTRSFAVVAVARACRRQGIGSTLLDGLRRLGDGRPLLARVREDDPAGRGFANAHGFEIVMRSRVGIVDPADPEVEAWITANSVSPIDTRPARVELAVAHEAAYRAEHRHWSPATERPLEESLRLFCGESFLPETAVVVRSAAGIDAVAALHGPPLSPSCTELFLIAGSATGDTTALRSAVAAELLAARMHDAVVSIEADDANTELSAILAELPATREPALLLLTTSA